MSLSLFLAGEKNFEHTKKWRQKFFSRQPIRFARAKRDKESYVRSFAPKSQRTTKKKYINKHLENKKTSPPPLPTYSSRGVTSLERCHGHRIKIQGHRLRSGYKMAESFESVPRAWTHSLGLRKNMRGCWTRDQTFWREKKEENGARGCEWGGGIRVAVCSCSIYGPKNTLSCEKVECASGIFLAQNRTQSKFWKLL